MPDEKWGEAVHAAVQLKPGADVTAQDLMDHVKQRLGGVHAPKKVHFMTQLPRSSVGKVLKKDIREQLAKQ
jgi:acyl-CoA synthetase (AMP-forming)/AMP-acid ligase II